MNRDLAAYLTPAEDAQVCFAGQYPADYLVRPAAATAGLAPGRRAGPAGCSELTGAEPKDGYPVLLADWIRRDGLKCLKVKLRGNDAAWDYERLVQVGHDRRRSTASTG